MKRRLFKTLVAVLAIAAAATGPARAQQTYSVTFAGFVNDWMNTTVSDATMPYSVSGINDYFIAPWNVWSGGDRFTNVYVASGGDGKVSVSYNMSLMTITVTGAFEGTATIHCEGKDEEEVDVSCDITVACVANALPLTMRTLTGVPQGWQVQAGDPLAVVDSNADGSYSIEAGQPVLVVPSAEDKPRVKSVTLVEVQAPAPAGPTLDLATVTAATTVEDGYTLTGTLGANVKISIADGATVTLDGVTINGVRNNSYAWAGITCLGDATIILSGTNTVKGFYEDYPGIFVPENKTLTIQGAGSLTASSNGFGAGIGGGYQIACGNIVIEGGTVNAQGGTYAAGIGGGNENSCGNISITGGTVNAQGGYNAAGIGSGDKNSCGNISITGGTITATGGSNYGAGIGSGDRGSCGTVSITGGTITATGGNYAAGIGSGYRGSCDNISITGGTITATGGNYGAGIGSGDKGSCGTVTITGGVTSVTATKGFDAPNSIGAGYNGTCGTVTIGGTVGAITTSPYTYTPGN